MRGYPLARTSSSGGAWVYTLYEGDEPFVHALDTVHGRALVEHPAQVVAVGHALPRAQALGLEPVVLELQLAHPEQVAHAGQELRVVPGLGQVVARALLHHLHRRLQRRPGGEHQHGQVGIDAAHPAEQLDAFAPRGRPGREVHVLHDDADFLPFHHGQRVLRRLRHQAGDRVDLEQDFERLRDGGLVLDDQYASHRPRSITRSGSRWRARCGRRAGPGPVSPGARPPRARPRRRRAGRR